MTDLNIRLSGKADGKPVILLHALAANLTFWDDFIAAMGPDFRFAAYDQRGFGASLRPTREWTVADHVADLESVRRAVGFDKAALVGTAVGGVIALNYAELYPGHVTAVVVTNPTLGAKRATSLERVLKMKAGGGGMEVIVDEAVARAYGDLPHDDRYHHYRNEIFLKNDPLGYELTVRGIVEQSIEPILPKIKSPVLVIAGELDRVTPPDVARHVAGLLPNSRLSILARASHFSPYQAPADCAALAGPFLREF